MEGCICRLCFKVVTDNSYEFLEESKRIKLEEITAALNLEVVVMPIVCKNCSESIERYSNFKLVCLKSFGRFENNTVRAPVDSQFNSLLEGGGFNRDSVDVKGELKPCCLCFRNASLNPSDGLKLESDVIRQMVKVCLPEIESRIAIEEFTICRECFKCLENQYNFIIMSLEVETKVMDYCKSTDNFNLVNLDNVFEFNHTIKRDPDGNNVSMLDGIEEHPSVDIYCSDIKDDTKNESTSDKELVINLTRDSIFNFNSKILGDTDKCGSDNKQLGQDRRKKINKTLPVYQCNQCSFTTYNRSTLGSHTRVKHGTTIFKCNQCDYQTNIKWNLTTHTKCKHSSLGRPFKCSDCDYRSKTKATLKQHIFRQHKDTEIKEIFSCEYCSYKTHEKGYVLAHIKLVHTGETIKCPKCDFTTIRKDSLSKHMKYLHPEEIVPLQCPSCSFITLREDSYKKHIRKHKDPNPNIYKCHDCSYQCDEKSRLVKHLRIHKQSEKLPTYACGMCPYNTKIKSYLTKHVKVVHTINEGTYECNFCHKKSKTKGDLRKHMIVHKTGDKVWQACDVCNFKSRHKKSLQNHMLRHKPLEEIQLFKCDLCTYQSKQKSNLNTHMKIIHENKIVWYYCDKCEYRGKYKHSLETHSLVHKDKSEVKTFTCYTCGFETKHKSTLKKHVLQHMEPGHCKMYKCKMCDFQTKYKGYIKTHITFH